MKFVTNFYSNKSLLNKYLYHWSYRILVKHKNNIYSFW